MIVNDCKTLLEHSKHNNAATDGPAGCVGYCMSGPFAFAAAAQMADRLKATASIHGVALVTDKADSPHIQADKISGEI